MYFNVFNRVYEMINRNRFRWSRSNGSIFQPG